MVHVAHSSPIKDVAPWGICTPVMASEKSISYALERKGRRDEKEGRERGKDRKR
jgi:hypothetical protein